MRHLSCPVDRSLREAAREQVRESQVTVNDDFPANVDCIRRHRSKRDFIPDALLSVQHYTLAGRAVPLGFVAILEFCSCRGVQGIAVIRPSLVPLAQRKLRKA